MTDNILKIRSAAETKWEAINHLDKYLTEFADKLEARGTKVHWCSTPDQARVASQGRGYRRGGRRAPPFRQEEDHEHS